MIKVYWEVNDGFVGNGEQLTKINDDEFEDCDTEEEKQILIEDIVQEEFENRIGWNIKRIEKV